eukprot:357901-Chlamydomonas_euryale.AAC.3
MRPHLLTFTVEPWPRSYSGNAPSPPPTGPARSRRHRCLPSANACCSPRLVKVDALLCSRGCLFVSGLACGTPDLVAAVGLVWHEHGKSMQLAWRAHGMSTERACSQHG